MMQEALRKVGLRELHLALLGIGTILTAILIVSAVLPQIKQMRGAAASISLLDESSQDNQELDRRLRDQHRRIEELRFQLYGDMANLPIRQVESYIIGRLQRISWNNNVELVSVAPQMGERVQIFQEMLFNVELVGHYDDLYRWLWETRQELGFVVVKEYGIRRRDNVDDDPLLVAELNLATYRAVE